MSRRHRHRGAVLLLNSSFEILDRIDFNRAVTMLVQGTANAFESMAEEFVCGPPQPDGSRLKIPVPVSVVLKNYVHVDYDTVGKMDDILAARSAILHRDGFCCMYCGGPATTIDHVLPESRGGENTWLNLVAACSDCNFFKAARTPEEAGMVLLREPFVPTHDKYAREQKQVWKMLAEGSLEVSEGLYD